MGSVVGLVPFETQTASEGLSSSKLSLPFNIVEVFERSMGSIQTGSLGFYADGVCGQLSTEGHVFCKPEVAGYRGSIRGNQMKQGEAASRAISKGLQKLMGVTSPSVGGLADRVVRSGFISKLVIGNTSRHIGKHSTVLRLSAQRGGRIYAAVSSKRTDDQDIMKKDAVLAGVFGLFGSPQVIGKETGMIVLVIAAFWSPQLLIGEETDVVVLVMEEFGSPQALTGEETGMVVLVMVAFGSPQVLIGEETGTVILVIGRLALGSPRVLVGEEAVHKDTVWAHVGFGGTTQRQLHVFTVGDH